MGRRVAEQVVRARRLGAKKVVRVDLHGVSVFGRKDADHQLIRWERIESIDLDAGGVVVRSARTEIRLPSRAFGLEPADLAERLGAARSMEARPEVIAGLAGHE